jgi:hypothetical protein
MGYVLSLSIGLLFVFIGIEGWRAQYSDQFKGDMVAINHFRLFAPFLETIGVVLMIDPLITQTLLTLGIIAMLIVAWGILWTMTHNPGQKPQF